MKSSLYTGFPNEIAGVPCEHWSGGSVRVVATVHINIAEPPEVIGCVQMEYGDVLLATGQMQNPRDNGLWIWSDAKLPLVRPAGYPDGHRYVGTHLVFSDISDGLYSSGYAIVSDQNCFMIGYDDVTFSSIKVDGDPSHSGSYSSSSSEVNSALSEINKYRRSHYQKLLNPAVAGWTDDDVLAEYKRLVERGGIK